MSSTYADKNNPVLFLVQAPAELPRTAFPTRGLHVGDRTNFVQGEPLGLQGLPMMLAIHVVEDVSVCLDILTLFFFVQPWSVLHF